MNLETFEDVKKLVDDNNVRVIEISPFFNDSKMYYNATGDGVYIFFTKTWCEKNQELLNKILVYIIQNHKDKKLIINSGSLINNQVIKAIAGNKNIEEVLFGNFFDSYTLRESDYLTLKDSIKKIETSGVEEKLKYNFDEIIDYNRRKNLISFYKYDALQAGEIYLTELVDVEHIDYIKCIGADAIIKASPSVNVFDIVEKLRSANKNNKVTYRLGDKKIQFNEELFKRNICYENLFIEIGMQKYSLKEYMEYEKVLYSMVLPAQNLSPFEKYIYAYDIVKRFKKYKEHKKDKMKARRLYDILNNNYMVCVAYSDMLGDLLSKLGIENIELHVEVELRPYKAVAQLKSKYGDKWEKMEQQEKYKLIDEQKNYIPDSWGGHSRRLVHIVDEKYGINGLYFSDPTWDNDLENNSYNFLLMTLEEVLSSRKKFKFEDSPYELLYVSSIQEFNRKLNIILNRTKISAYMNYQRKFEYISRELSLIIMNIDIQFYNKLCEKYEFIRNNNFKIEDIYNLPMEVVDYLYDIAHYISSNINNFVDGKTIFEVVKNVYDDVFVDGVSKEQMKNIQTYNSKQAERNFDVNKFK
ncbi:MAG: hypothetical protein J6D28_03685 [Bacilli bacterium]|nr:hypothetical protein [Bacilli bacterium]